MRSAPLLFVLSLVVPFAGCDKIEAPDNPKPGPCDGGGNGYGFRRVLIEDMTGFTCPNCPQAAEIARDLQNLYCGDVVVIAEHVNAAFAEPTSNVPGDPFSTDFRTEAGNTYESQFGIASLPSGLINRTSINGVYPLSRGQWAQHVSDLIGAPSEFEVVIDTAAFNGGTSTYDFSVHVPVLQSVNGEYDLTVLLIEDSVIEGQVDSRFDPPALYPYTHRHVLRTAVTAPLGDQLIAFSANAGQTITPPSFHLTLPPNVLEPAHCTLVAFVSRAGDYEILQVSELHLIPD